MDAPILINQVVHSTEENRDYRILWNGTPGFWICLNSKENIPREFSMEKLLEGIQSGLYTLVPDLWMASPGVQAPSASSIRRRDRVWALIGDIVTKEPAIYDQEQRKTLLKEKSVSSGVAVSNLYPHLGRYWRGGKVPDTLLGNYQTCGKCRDPYKENATRLGRKKKAGAAGKTLTVRDLQYFREAICAYHLNGDKLSLEKTYKKLIGDHYTVKDKAGNVTTIPCDSVIASTGYLPAPLADQGKKDVYLVGDCKKIGNLRSVIWGAYEAAMKIK